MILGFLRDVGKRMIAGDEITAVKALVRHAVEPLGFFRTTMDRLSYSSGV
jgi:hypothetical protein